MKRSIVDGAIFVVANAVDAGATVELVGRGHFELMPVASLLLGFGDVTFLVAKVTAACFVAVALARCRPSALLFLSRIFVAIAAWNLLWCVVCS